MHISIYGDESINNNIVCYAIFIIPTDKIKICEDIISQIKNYYNIPNDYFLHCKTLFHNDSRNQLKFNITQESIENVYRNIALQFQQANVFVGYADKLSIPRDETMTHWDDGTLVHDKLQKIHYGDNELVHWCKNMCMLPIIQKKTSSDYTFYPDPNPNGRMKWCGKKKAKMMNAEYNMMFDQPEHSEPFPKAIETVLNNKPPLLQVADFIAYSFAKAKTIQNYKNKQYFIDTIKYFKIQEITFNYNS